MDAVSALSVFLIPVPGRLRRCALNQEPYFVTAHLSFYSPLYFTTHRHPHSPSIGTPASTSSTRSGPATLPLTTPSQDSQHYPELRSVRPDRYLAVSPPATLCSRFPHKQADAWLPDSAHEARQSRGQFDSSTRFPDPQTIFYVTHCPSRPSAVTHSSCGALPNKRWGDANTQAWVRAAVVAASGAAPVLHDSIIEPIGGKTLE